MTTTKYQVSTEVKVLCVTYSSLPTVVVSAFAVVSVRAKTRADDAGDVAGTAVGFSEGDAVHDHQCRRQTTPSVSKYVKVTIIDITINTTRRILSSGGHDLLLNVSYTNFLHTYFSVQGSGKL